MRYSPAAASRFRRLAKSTTACGSIRIGCGSLIFRCVPYDTLLDEASMHLALGLLRRSGHMPNIPTSTHSASGASTGEQDVGLNSR